MADGHGREGGRSSNPGATEASFERKSVKHLHHHEFVGPLNTTFCAPPGVSFGQDQATLAQSLGS